MMCWPLVVSAPVLPSVITSIVQGIKKITLKQGMKEDNPIEDTVEDCSNGSASDGIPLITDAKLLFGSMFFFLGRFEAQIVWSLQLVFIHFLC